DAAPVQEVIARTHCITDYMDRRLPGSAGVCPANPWHAIVPVGRFGCLYGGDCISRANGLRQSDALGQLIPAHLTARKVGHAACHGAAGELRSIEIESRLENAVRQKIVEA